MRRTCELLSIPVICFAVLLFASPMAKAAALQSVLGPLKGAGDNAATLRVHGWHCSRRYGWFEHRHGRRGWHSHRRRHRHLDACSDIYYRSYEPAPYVYIPGPSYYYYTPRRRYYRKHRRRYVAPRRFRNRKARRYVAPRRFRHRKARRRHLAPRVYRQRRVGRRLGPQLRRRSPAVQRRYRDPDGGRNP